MNWKHKNCGGELVQQTFYDEEGVEGYECVECDETFLCVWGDEDCDERMEPVENSLGEK